MKILLILVIVEVKLDTEKEIIFCTYDEIKKIYNDLYDEFDRELQDPRNNLFITNLLIKYQTNFVTITRNNLKSLNQEAKVNRYYNLVPA